jgi:hypothetical protein
MLSGLLLVCFIAIPEMFAYTFMVLFDYCNAVFFFLSIYFLIEFFKTTQKVYLVFAALQMAIATYTRNETLVLACFITPAILFNGIKQKTGMIKILLRIVIFLLPAVVCYVLCVTVYLNHYLPVKYNVHDLINAHLANLRPLFTRFKDINAELIFSTDGISYYSYFIFIFLLLVSAELIFKKWFTADAGNWLYAVLVIYIGLAILGYLLPLMDLDNTTKRGLFKIFPLMLLYMANNGLLVNFSTRITVWQQQSKAISKPA